MGCVLALAVGSIVDPVFVAASVAAYCSLGHPRVYTAVLDGFWVVCLIVLMSVEVVLTFMGRHAGQLADRLLDHFQGDPEEVHVSSVYKNSQNVHVSSVQARTRDNLQTLEKLWSTVSPIGDASSRWLIATSTRHKIPMKTWLLDGTRFGGDGPTFGDVLAMVLHVIEAHPSRDDLRKILVDELKASKGTCFTGRVTRVLGVLSGFVEGIDVDVSPAEHMQARLSVAAKAGDVRSARKILDEFGISGHARDAWMDAVHSAM